MKKFMWSELENAANFYAEEGYVVLANAKNDYVETMHELFAMFSSMDLAAVKGSAFLNEEGIPRHKIDLIRNYSKVRDCYEKHLNTLISEFCNYLGMSQAVYFTHCKLSFKIPNKQVNWFPHQDIGYKSSKEQRKGFAMFMALEDMDINNGTLEIYEGSHRHGRLGHDRKTENIDLGDGQMEVSLTDRFKKISLGLSRGDIVVFSQYMVHSSGISKTNSNRLAIISELEELRGNLPLDDYGKLPIFVNPQNFSFIENSKMWLKSLLSPTKYWFNIRDIRFLNKIARKLITVIKNR